MFVMYSCLKESVFPMETHLDMGNSYIYNVKYPINNYQETSKGNVDGKLTKKVNTSVAQNVIIIILIMIITHKERSTEELQKLVNL